MFEDYKRAFKNELNYVIFGVQAYRAITIQTCYLSHYIVKPFVIGELVARLAAVSRRAGTVQSGRIEVGDLVVDTEALRVWRGSDEIGLTAQEFRLLRYLAEHRGRVLPRTRILEAVWDLQDDPGSNVVDVYVSYLRAKVDKGRSEPLIHTVRGLGYVLEQRA